MGAFGSVLRSLRRHGPGATVAKAGLRGRIAIDRAALQLLRLRYGFAPWHAESPLSSRPYRRELARLIDSLAPTTVVDVGCGLGAMLALVGAPDKAGYDIDPGAIRAARRLHGRKATFRVGGFDAVVEPSIDVLVAVNWIHDFDPARLDAWLTPLFARTHFLVVDAVDLGEPGYAHHHDFAFFSRRAALVESHRFGEGNRRFLLYRVVT